MSARLRRRLAAGGAVLAAVLLAGCSAMVAQNPDSPLRPVNAVRSGDDARLMLRGYDLVAYVEQAQAVRGSPRHRSDHEGVSYFFASAENLARFQAAPARYQPAYHGYDATRIVYAIPEPADPQVWALIDGRVFLFTDAASKAAFELDAPANIAMADRWWHDEVAGSNAAWQRLWRSVDRVPHYRSRDELARDVAQAGAKPR